MVTYAALQSTVRKNLYPTMGEANERRRIGIGILRGTLDMLILRMLQYGPRHGYGLCKLICINSNGVLNIDTGTLYPAMHRMERRGWIAADWTSSEIGPRTRIYTLTAKGRKQLRTRRFYWEHLASAIVRILNQQERSCDL